MAALTDFQKTKLQELNTDRDAIRAAIASGDSSFTLQGAVTVAVRGATDLRAALRIVNAELRALLIDITGNNLNTLDYEAQ